MGSIYNHRSKLAKMKVNAERIHAEGRQHTREALPREEGSGAGGRDSSGQEEGGEREAHVDNLV